MLKYDVRTYKSIVFLSVTALSLLLQPLCFQPVYAEEQPFATPLNQALEFARTIDTEVGEHSFYPDLLIGPDGEITTLIVVPLEAFREDMVETVQSIGSRFHIAVVAPRHRPSLIPSVIERYPGVTQQTAVIYLRLGSQSEWRVAVEDLVSPVWITDHIIRSDSAPFSPALVNAARLGLGQWDPVLKSALDHHQSAARLIVHRFDTLPDTIDRFAKTIRRTQQETRRFEQNYLIVPGLTIPRFEVTIQPFILSEAVLVWGIVIVAAFFLLFAVSRPRRVSRYVSAVRHNVFLFLSLFAVLFGSLVTGNLLIRVLLNLFPGTMSAIPLVTIKFALGLIALTLLYPLTHGKFRRSSTVYSGAALFFLMLGSLIASLFSIILGAFFVLATIFGFLFSLSHNAPLKAISLILAFIPGTYLLFEVAAIADSETIRSLLTPAIWRELVTAILVFPLVLMFFRLDILVTFIPLLPIVGMVATIGIAISTAFLVDDITSGPPPTVRVREVYPPPDGSDLSSVPETGEITIVGQWPEGIVTTILSDGTEIRCPTPPCTETVVARPPPVTLATSVADALDRYTVSYEVEFRQPAQAMDLTIRSETEIQLYATDLPASVQIGATGKEFVFTPGPFPPSNVAGTIVFRGVTTPSRLRTRVHAKFENDIARVAHDLPQIPLELRRSVAEWTIRTERVLE